MKKLSSSFCGFLAGILLCSLVITAYAAKQIKSADYSNAKICFYGQEIPITAQLAVIKDTGADSTPKLYFPVELMEYMQFKIDWNDEKNTVNLTMSANSEDFQHSSNPSTLPEMSDIDKKALDIMQRTGNWGYIEAYLPKMTNGGIDAVVSSYNSKHINPKEHKKASNYYN